MEKYADNATYVMHENAHIIKQLLYEKIRQILGKTSKFDFLKIISWHISNFSRHTNVPRHTV
jgi:hypothetical protein